MELVSVPYHIMITLKKKGFGISHDWGFISLIALSPLEIKLGEHHGTTCETDKLTHKLNLL